MTPSRRQRMQHPRSALTKKLNNPFNHFASTNPISFIADVGCGWIRLVKQGRD